MLISKTNRKQQQQPIFLYGWPTDILKIPVIALQKEIAKTQLIVGENLRQMHYDPNIKTGKRGTIYSYLHYAIGVPLFCLHYEHPSEIAHIICSKCPLHLIPRE